MRLHMPSVRAFWKNHRQYALVLLVLTLAVRALLPTGYMIGSGPKSITVYVCTQADGMPNKLTIPLDSETPVNDHDKDDQGPCAFAGMALAVDLPTSDAVMFVPIAANFAVMLPMVAAPGRGLAAPPPYATGPPTLI